MGVYGKDFEAARLTYFGLWALQHRGQEASGISASNGKTITTHKGEGLVAHVYKEEDLKLLTGTLAIGHNRYGTSGGKGSIHAQPVTTKKNLVALAHNGNLPSTQKLEEFLHEKNIDTSGFNDSEMMQKAIEWYVAKGNRIETAIKNCFPLFTGAFCLVVLTKNKLIALRDPYGIHPLSLGKLNGGYIVASETCALDTVNATFIRDIRPGEMLVIDNKGLHSYQVKKGQQKLDIFEFIYFARPDSILLGKSVNEVRRNLGVQLAKEFPLKADIVIPVPDSAIPAALGYSQASGIPFHHGFIKNRYIHRTFIRPEQHLRERDIQIKLNPLAKLLKGKDVIVVDDSIVRGSTSKKIVAMLKRIGVKKVHMVVSCPPIRYPDFYGIDTPAQSELVAANRSIPEIKDYIQADSLSYLSFDGMIRATGLAERYFNTSQFSGNYPIDLHEKEKTITFSWKKIGKSPATPSRIVGLGAINIDLIYPITSEKEHPATRQEFIEAGGAAGNTLSALSKLGISARILGKIGSDTYAPMLLQSLSSHGVDSTHITQDSSSPSGSSVVLVDPAGVRSTYIKPGANAFLEKSDIDTSVLSNAEQIYFSTVVDEKQFHIQQSIAKEFGRNKKISFWLDKYILPFGIERLKPMLPFLHTVFITNDVLEKLTTYRGKEGAAHLIEHGVKTLAIITNSHESEIVTADAYYHITTPSTPFKDATGANCAYAAGFLYGQFHGQSLQQSAYLGHTLSSFVGESYGARSNLPTLKQTLQRLISLKKEKNILVVGSGGREHAIAWKLAQSDKVKRIYVAPGNPGMADVAHPIPIASDDITQLKLFAKQHTIDMTIVGPEVPLAKGLVDEFEMDGLVAFGPTKSAAELETSKAFSKDFMKRFSIPTAKYEVFTDWKKAQAYLKKTSFPQVIKADGLAAGKGVLVAKNRQEAETFLKEIMQNKKFGDAGTKVIIEEYLEGEETSILAFSDGEHVIPLLPAQDHKRVFDNDQGPNTGGMGAYAPATFVTPSILEQIVTTILLPTIQGMKEIGRPYKGILFAGIMLTKKGPKVLEFNCRFGDPETQAILPLLQTDLLDIVDSVITETLAAKKLTWKKGAGVCVIVASGGYPDNVITGKEIAGVEKKVVTNGSYVFHSGTTTKLLTAGGRVLGIFATGDTLKDAIAHSYNKLQNISFEEMHYRQDIGKKGLSHS